MYHLSNPYYIYRIYNHKSKDIKNPRVSPGIICYGLAIRKAAFALTVGRVFLLFLDLLTLFSASNESLSPLSTKSLLFKESNRSDEDAVLFVIFTSSSIALAIRITTSSFTPPLPDDGMFTDVLGAVRDAELLYTPGVDLAYRLDDADVDDLGLLI